MDPYISVIIVVLLALVIGVFVWFVVLGFQVRSQTFSGTFSASQVPSDSPGSGTLSGTLTPGIFRYDIRVSLPSTDTVTQVGIYQNGTPLLLIIGPTSPPYEWAGEWDLSTTQSQALLNGNLYVLVSTRKYPNGALRAAILPS